MIDPRPGVRVSHPPVGGLGFSLLLLLVLGCGGGGPPEAAAPREPGPPAGTVHEAAKGSSGHGGPAAGHEVPGEVLSLDVSTDGDNLDVLMALRDAPEARLLHRRSRDGGRSWGEPTEVDLGGHPMHAPSRGMDPQIAARGDRILAVWTAPGTSAWGSGPMATSFSTDGGRTWTPGPTPADDGRTDGHNYIDAVASPEGEFHVVWLDTREEGRGLSTSHSSDGRTWSASRTLDEFTCMCCWNRAYRSVGGELRVLYRDKKPTDLALAVSPGGGESWIRRGSVGAFQWSFEGCPHVGGALAEVVSPGTPRLHALSWTGADGSAGLWALGSPDGGATWSAPQRIGSPRAKHGDLAADGEDLIAVWDEGPRIFTARSADAGATWSPAQLLSAEDEVATHPRVLATAQGVVAMWTSKASEGGWRWVTRRLEPSA